jgi:XisI protein
VLDTIQNRYQLQHLEQKQPALISRTLAYLEIRAEKIWIEVDNTEKGIATELVAQGIAKSQIVLAFYPRALREMGEFAVG